MIISTPQEALEAFRAQPLSGIAVVYAFLVGLCVAGLVLYGLINDVMAWWIDFREERKKKCAELNNWKSWLH